VHVEDGEGGRDRGSAGRQSGYYSVILISITPYVRRSRHANRMRPRERIAKRGFSLLAEKPMCFPRVVYPSGFRLRNKGTPLRGFINEAVSRKFVCTILFYGYTIISAKREELGTDVIAFQDRSRNAEPRRGRQSGLVRKIIIHLRRA